MRKSSLLIRLVALLVAISCWTASSRAAIDTLEIPLMENFDLFGTQIETVQYYHDGLKLFSTTGIYDTGASVVSFSFMDRLMNDPFGDELPGQAIQIKVHGGAQGDGIGGGLTGDVSEPGAVMAYGLSSLDNIFDLLFAEGPAFNPALAVSGVQMFVGAYPGSESLPTITGTPIHYPTTAHPNGTAAKINMTGYRLDLGELLPEFAGLVFELPDVSFVESRSTTLDPRRDATSGDLTTSPVVRIPLALFGEDNHTNPQDMITVAPNPVQPNIRVEHGEDCVTGKMFLFDTGAQLSVISSEIADALHLNLDDADGYTDVQGASGTPVQVPWFLVDALELPRDDNGDGEIDGALRFTHVPIHVLDVGFGIDGILGMNLFNMAADMLYDPYAAGGPSLQLTFFDPATLIRDDPTDDESDAMVDFLATFPSFAGMLGLWNNSFTHYQFEAPVPEPSTFLLLAMGAVAILAVRRRRQEPVGWVERTSAMRQDA
jgi:hypothetical protein